MKRKAKVKVPVAIYSPPLVAVFVPPDMAAAVEHLKDWLRERVSDGAECPVCTQLAKVYSNRTITSAMAKVLMQLSHYPAGEWVHVQNELKVKGGDYGKLKFWGFLEPASAVRDDGSPRSGFWRITPEGRRFALDEIRTAKYAIVFNDRLMRLDDSETIGIRNALGTKFRYDDLMGPRLRAVPSP